LGYPGPDLKERWNLQLRVQILPRTMNVAVPSFQHSVWFGQAALWQTVWSLLVKIRLRTVFNCSPALSLILNQGGSLLGIAREFMLEKSQCKQFGL
jgi:hypothetical protein